MLRDKGYLLHLRDERCIITGRKGSDTESVVAAHIGTGGKGLKSPDSHTLPMLQSVHTRCHQYGEMTVLRQLIPDQLLRLMIQAYAEKQYKEYHG